MTAAAALAAARAAGLTVTAAGDRLRWRGPPPPAEVLALLRENKAALLALLAANDAAPFAAAPGADDDPDRAGAAQNLAWAGEQATGGWPGFVTDPTALPPASPEQAEAERQDRAAVAADPRPAATEPVPAATLAAWELELAALLAAGPACQLITDTKAAIPYFAAEARRRLGLVKHDHAAAGLLMGFWRHARMAAP